MPRDTHWRPKLERNWYIQFENGIQINILHWISHLGSMEPEGIRKQLIDYVLWGTKTTGSPNSRKDQSALQGNGTDRKVQTFMLTTTTTMTMMIRMIRIMVMMVIIMFIYCNFTLIPRVMSGKQQINKVYWAYHEKVSLDFTCIYVTICHCVSRRPALSAFVGPFHNLMISWRWCDIFKVNWAHLDFVNRPSS
jgi:hypothetical protein